MWLVIRNRRILGRLEGRALMLLLMVGFILIRSISLDDDFGNPPCEEERH